MTTAAAGALACAGVIAAVPASAADMLSLGVGGYMEQWVGYANRDDMGADGGFDSQSDSEIHFRGSLESDSGLKFTVHVELEANNSGGGDSGDANTEIDESFARMSGEFGTLELGQRDPIHARTHYAAAFGAGVGLNAGDTQKWIPGSYLETAGWTAAGDDLGVIYITPRVNGVQVGMSYHPDSTNENAPTGAPMGNDDSVVAAGVNFNQNVGDMSIKVSLGHLSRSRSGGVMFDLDQDNDGNRNSELKAKDDLMKGNDNATFTNAGLSVGMGAFTFSASYATRDDGGYMSRCYAYDGDGEADLAAAVAEAAETNTSDFMPALPAIENGDMIPCDGIDSRYGGGTPVVLVFDGSMGTADAEAAAADSAVNAKHMFVEDESGQHDTWAVGISYTDGPMSVSIGHMVRDREDGVERTATMVSGGYKLAPGVDWKTSIFSVDDDAGGEGTAFVTGLDLAF